MTTPSAFFLEMPALGGGVAGLDFGGTAPTRLIFLHANGMNAGVYRQLLEPLRDEARILALDLRGHGQTSLPADPATLTDWTRFRDDVIAVIEALGEGPVVLAGHSMGGTTSLLAAGARPDLVRALALADPVMAPDVVRLVTKTRWGKERMHRWMPLARGALRRRARFPDRATALAGYRGRGGFKTWPDQALEDYVARGFVERDGGVELACDPLWEAACFSCHGHDVWRAVKNISGPIFVRAADGFSTCSRSAARRLRRLAPQSKIIRPPDTTHFLPIEAPELFRPALRAAITA